MSSSAQRWSPRAFDAARPVTRAELMKLFEAARWAPSSFNAQPWRFIVLERDTQHGRVAADAGHVDAEESVMGRGGAGAGA